MKDQRGLVEVRILAQGKDHTYSPAREYTHEGKAYIEAQLGRRFAVEVRNLTAGPVEVVMSVDGLDVHDQKAASWKKAGFIIGRYNSYIFQGFRISQEGVAAFRFGALDAAYAMVMGTPDNIGVIGVAIFQEQKRYHYPWGEPDVLDKLFDSSLIPTPTTVEPTRTLTPDMFIRARPEGLGTVAGETRHGDRVVPTSFERLTQEPAAVVTIRYEDRANLEKLGIKVIDFPEGLARRELASAFPEARKRLLPLTPTPTRFR